MNRHLLGAAVALAATLLVPARARAQEAGIMLDAAAPGALVETLDGKRVDLASYFHGKPAVLEFWATWCPLCKQLESPLAVARAKYAGRVTFISIGVRDNQSAKRQKSYTESKHLGGTFLFDREGKAVAAYKAPHTSYLVVINADGKVVYTGVGGDQDVDGAVAKAFDTGGAMKHAMDHAMDHGN